MRIYILEEIINDADFGQPQTMIRYYSTDALALTAKAQSIINQETDQEPNEFQIYSVEVDLSLEIEDDRDPPEYSVD